jgi:hypothetical protein
MAMMHTKLFRMKWVVFWVILLITVFDQEQVGEPGAPLHVHGVGQEKRCRLTTNFGPLVNLVD